MYACVCVRVCYYADHEYSSRQVQLSKLDTVNVGWSPGCWIMDQRRTPAQPNAVWSDVTVISADWSGPQRADSSLCRLVNHTHGHARGGKRSSGRTWDDLRIFIQVQAIACYEPAYLVGSLNASTLPNAVSFRAESYWACYSPVMNPVARLAWLRFLLHIPKRCQGPHRRQRSLPKSQPCYTDECVCPVLWSRLSASVCLCARLCFSACFPCVHVSLCPCMCVSPPLCLFCLPVCVASYVVILENEIRDGCVGSW